MNDDRGTGRPWLAWLRLVRVGTLFSPAADVLAGACLVGGAWSGEVVRAMVASVAIYAAGMVLNDHADRKSDALTRPERPIPAGRISPTVALAAGVTLMLLGLTLAPHRPYYAAIAGLVLAYDYLGKRVAVAGAFNMGLLRGMNLLAGAVTVTGALPDARAAWLAAGAYGIYIFAVTILGIYEDARQVNPRAVVGVQSVPPVVAALALLATPQPWPAAAIGVALALAFARRAHRRGRAWDRAAIRGSMTWLLLGTMLYTSLLCLGSGRPLESLAIALAVLPARWISRTIALT